MLDAVAFIIAAFTSAAVVYVGLRLFLMGRKEHASLRDESSRWVDHAIEIHSKTAGMVRGTSIKRDCVCGQVNPAVAKFCRRCGRMKVSR